MCESTALLLKEDREEILMENVASLEVKEGKLILRDILGKETVLEGATLERIDFLKHKIFIKKS